MIAPLLQPRILCLKNFQPSFASRFAAGNPHPPSLTFPSPCMSAGPNPGPIALSRQNSLCFSLSCSMPRGADAQFELLPLGWERIEIPIAEALQHAILSAEIAQLYPRNADRPSRVAVYRFYNQPADTKCIDWRDYQFIPALMDTRSSTIHRPKGTKHLFWCYNCVLVSNPESNLLEESKKTLDWNILRQNNIKRIMYIAGFKYFIQQERTAQLVLMTI